MWKYILKEAELSEAAWVKAQAVALDKKEKVKIFENFLIHSLFLLLFFSWDYSFKHKTCLKQCYLLNSDSFWNPLKTKILVPRIYSLIWFLRNDLNSYT